MRFIDTHTHLDDDAFADDLHDVLQRSRNEGVDRWINVGFNEERWLSTIALTRELDNASMMLGLHPGDADGWGDELLAKLSNLVEREQPVAIGEVGLDLHWRQDNLAQQERAFRAQLDLALQFDLPAVIHIRAADDQMLWLLSSRSNLPPLHFHSFDGGEKLQQWVVRSRSTIGVGGLLTRNNSGELRRWIATLPRDRIVLETDAPYLKPRGNRGTRNEPAFLRSTAKVVAELWRTDVDDVARQTTQNAERIFRLHRE